jgi:hypothetical protein
MQKYYSKFLPIFGGQVGDAFFLRFLSQMAHVGALVYLSNITMIEGASSAGIALRIIVLSDIAAAQSV